MDYFIHNIIITDMVIINIIYFTVPTNETKSDLLSHNGLHKTSPFLVSAQNYVPTEFKDEFKNSSKKKTNI